MVVLLCIGERSHIDGSMITFYFYFVNGEEDFKLNQIFNEDKTSCNELVKYIFLGIIISVLLDIQSIRLMIVHVLLVHLDVLFLGLELPLMRC